MPNIGKKTKENETKREKFVRLAESRMNNVLKQLELLSNLSNTSAYEYSQNDVDKIIKSLKNAVANVEKSFTPSNSNTKKFTLKESFIWDIEKK